MVSIKNIAELKDVLTIPFIFSNNGKRYTHALLELFNYSDGTTMSEDLLIVRWPDIEFANMTFNQLFEYLDDNSVTRINLLLNNFIQRSKLYDDSIHHIKITVHETTPISFFRVFVVPSVIPSESKSVVNQNVELVGNPIQSAKIINEFHFNETSLIGFDAYTILRCTLSDVIVHQSTYTETTNYLRQGLSVVNYEMTEAISFAIGRFAQKNNKLIVYNTKSQTTIFKPSVNLSKSSPRLNDGKTKSIQYAIKITCPVWNGLRYIDYGYLFYKNGIKLTALGSPSILKVSRKIGA